MSPSFTVVVPGQLDAAFVSFADLAGVVFFTLQRIETVFADDSALADDPNAGSRG